MNDQHISLSDLQYAVLEGPTERPLAEIEAHVAVCAECQQQMLSFAAEPAWRNRLATALTELQESHLLLPETTQVDRPDVDTHVEHDPYELDAARRFLETHLDTPSHPELLGRLGRYDVERIIGLGGMGVVVRGFDRELHRPVAIKMVLPRWSHNGTAKQRFAREARAAAAVLHPNVIAIHGIEEQEGIPYFVMPFVAGPTLQSLVEERGPLEEHEIVQIALQIASGLAAAHSQGLVHRDIKPGNVLVDNAVNRVVITDFGLARCEHDQSMTRTGWLAGTPNYMSPEQSRGEDVDPRSDLFSLGSLLYFLTTGQLPFVSDSPMGVLHKISHEPHRDVRHLNERVSSTLAEVIDRLLHKDREARFQSAVELEAFLHAYLNHLHRPLEAKLPELPVPTHRPAKQASSSIRKIQRWTGYAVGMSLLFVAGVFAANWLLPNPGTTPKQNQGPGRLGWNEIAEQYGLMEPEQFDTEITRLASETAQLERAMQSQPSWNDMAPLDTEIEGLRQAMEQVERQSGFLPPPRTLEPANVVPTESIPSTSTSEHSNSSNR